MRCQLSVACLPGLLGVICAAAVILHHASALDPPRFQVSALPQNVYQYGTHDGNVLTTASMGCIANVTNITFFRSRWFSMKCDGGESKLNSSDDRIVIRNGFVIVVDHIGTNAIINRLSYLDNGTYRCEIQENDITSQPISEWASATIQLRLDVRLQPVNNVDIIRTFNDSNFVKIACDMSGYIRPDEDLYWIVKGAPLSPSTNGGLKYRVSYHNGVNVAQFGGSSTVPSRMSMLTVLDVVLGDSGTYSCAINNTDLMKQVVLDVMTASRPSGHPQAVKVRSVSSTSIEVSWEEIPIADRNGNITHYEVHYSVGANVDSFEQPPIIIVTTDGPVLKANLQGLEEYTLYNISVSGVTVVGSGPSSPPVTNQTWEDLPSASPVNLMIMSVDKDALQVTWERPDKMDVNGVLRLYRIEYCGPITESDGGNLLRSTCTQVDVDGATNGIVLSSLKESSTYNVSVSAFTVGTGPATWKLAQTRMLQLPLQPGSEVLIIGVVVGVLLAVLVIVLVASIVIGFIVMDKFSRNQLRKKKSAIPSATEVPSEDLPPPHHVPASIDSEVGVANGAHESSSSIVGEELMDPITFKSSSESDQMATTLIATAVNKEQEPSDVNLQPKITLSELLIDEPPEYNLFQSASGSEELPHVNVDGNMKFDVSSECTAKKEDDIHFTCDTVKEQASNVKRELMELLQPRAADGQD